MGTGALLSSSFRCDCAPCHRKTDPRSDTLYVDILPHAVMEAGGRHHGTKKNSPVHLDELVQTKNDAGEIFANIPIGERQLGDAGKSASALVAHPASGSHMIAWVCASQMESIADGREKVSDEQCQLKERRRSPSQMDEQLVDAKERGSDEQCQLEERRRKQDEAERREQRRLEAERIERERREQERAVNEVVDRRRLDRWLEANDFPRGGVNARKRSLMKTTYPLHVAVSQADVKMVELLLQHRADPATRNSAGQTPVDLAGKLEEGASRGGLLRALRGAPR